MADFHARLDGEKSAAELRRPDAVAVVVRFRSSRGARRLPLRPGLRLLAIGAAILSAAAALTACGRSRERSATTTPTSRTSSISGAPAPCGQSRRPPSRYKHVVWIWFEDLPYGDVIGNTDAPFLNRLASQCGLATNYRAIAHPSLPNYIAATSGATQGQSDNCEPAECSTGAASIFSQTSWRFYAESMPSNCFKEDADPYTAHHNPPVYYTRLKDCSTRDLPLGTDISERFTFVLPNDSHSTEHDLADGDRWLQDYLPKLLRSAAYRSGQTVIFITWDEDDKAHRNHVPLLVITASTKPGARSDRAFDHYSLLRTTEQMLGLRCLGQSCSASSMRSAFGL